MNSTIHIREAAIEDIPALHHIRISVKENMLPRHDLITAFEYEEFLLRRGKGWVYEMEGIITGFAIVDLMKNNVWALFVHPYYEGQGIGKMLHHHMLSWYFTKTQDTLWLGTAFHTRAETFYRMLGWKETGLHGTKEIRFEMDYPTWIVLQ